MKGLRAPEFIASLGLTIITALPPALAGAMSGQIIRELMVSHTAFGFAIGAFFLANAVSSPMAGRLVDRLGPRNTTRLAVALSSLSMIGIAAAGAIYVALVVFLVIGGLAAALAGPAGSLLLTNVAGTTQQPLLFGVRQAFVPAASLVAGIAVPIFVAASLGWQWAFLIAAILSLVLVFPGRFRGANPTPFRSTTSSALTYKLHELWLLAVAFALAGSAAMSFNTFIVDYVMTLGMSADSGGVTLAIGSAAAVVARVFVGYLVGRTRLDSLEVTAGMLLVGVAGFVWILAGSGLSVLLASALALAGGWGWTGLVFYAVTFAFGESPGRANGVVQAGGAAGGILGPIVTGWVVEKYSYAPAWTLSSLSVLLAAVIVVGLCVHRRSRGTLLRS